MNNWLFYATGGLAYGGVSSTFNHSAPSLSSSANASSSTTRAGWTIGAGIEYGFAVKWTIRVEYLYYDLGRNSVTNIDTSACCVGDTATLSHRTAGSIVRAALNYRF